MKTTFAIRIRRATSFAISLLLLAGLPLPALASYSSVTGFDSDITEAYFYNKEYTVVNGSSLALAEELSAFVSQELLVQSPTVDWSIENDSNFAFSIDPRGNVFSDDDVGQATVTASLNGGKVTATVKLNAYKKATEVTATGFNFEESGYTFLTGSEAEKLKNDQLINVVASPPKSVFTAAQLTAIISELKMAADEGALSLTDGTKKVAPIIVKGENKVSLVYPNSSDPYNNIFGLSELTSAQIPPHTLKLEVTRFPAANENTSIRPLSVTTSASFRPAKLEEYLGSVGGITIKVGEKLSTEKLFAQGGGNTNVVFDIIYTNELAGDKSVTDDYATFTGNLVDPSEIVGIAVGENRIAATLSDSGIVPPPKASILVKVVATDLEAIRIAQAQPAEAQPELAEPTEVAPIPEAESSQIGGVGTIPPQTGETLLRRLF